MKIQWQDLYDTGIPEIDADHQRLVALINDLDDVLDEGGDLGRMGGVIDALIDYADYHFGREEAMMAQAGFGELVEHAVSHTEFGHFLGQLVGGCMLSPSRETAATIRDYLQEWLLDHILAEDMKYVPFVRERAETIH